MTAAVPPTRLDLRQAFQDLAAAQLHWTGLWHTASAPQPPPEDGLAALVQAHHHANFDLWHEEDRARDPAATDAEIARVKHAIDALNQRRNDLVEQIDEHLFRAAGLQPAAAPLHSETPGAMLDRLSILALKRFHTAEEIARPTAAEAHRARNRDRLALLEQQHRDLLGCLVDLWQEIEHGRRRFQLYRQLKMYNDPELNPVLYRDSRRPRSTSGS